MIYLINLLNFKMNFCKFLMNLFLYYYYSISWLFFIMNFKIQLFIFENEKKIKKYRLDEGEFTVGRHKSSDIVISDE